MNGRGRKEERRLAGEEEHEETHEVCYSWNLKKKKKKRRREREAAKE